MKGYEAAKAMHEGRKIRIKIWPSNWFLVLVNGQILDRSGKYGYIPMDNMFLDVWEIYKEPATLTQAAEHMKSGGYAKRPKHRNSIFVKDGEFFYRENDSSTYNFSYRMTLEDIEATDWELL